MASLVRRVDMALVMEQFDVGLVLLSRRLGRPPPPSYSVVHEHDEKPPLAPLRAADRAALVRANKYDLRVHAWASRQLRAWAAEAGIFSTPQRPLYACAPTGPRQLNPGPDKAWVRFYVTNEKCVLRTPVKFDDRTHRK
jgi:hypothetical protein